MIFLVYISKNCTKTKAPFTRVRFCLKTDIVLVPGLAYRPHVSRENGHRNASFQKRSPERRFLKTLATRLYVWANENGGFRIR